MANIIDKKEPIKVEGIDKDTVYHGAIYFYSKGDSPQTTIDFEYSHLFPDDYAGPVPGSLVFLRDVGNILARMTISYENFGLEDDTLEDPELTPEQRAEKILDYVAAVDEADKETKH